MIYFFIEIVREKNFELMKRFQTEPFELHESFPHLI